MTVTQAAQAILEIAVNKMSLAVREVSVEKGYDPRDFVLVASGGAGPLHVLDIARELHIPTVIVPLFPSHFSALGMLLADERHDFIRTYYADLGAIDFEDLLRVHDEMATEAEAGLRHARGASAANPSRSALYRSGIHFAGAGDAGSAEERRPPRHPHRLRPSLRATLRPPLAGGAGGDGQCPARRYRQAAQAEIPTQARRQAAAGTSPAGLSRQSRQAASPVRSMRARRSRPDRA